MADCKNCVNCEYIRGFMCDCHYSYDSVDDDGMKWHTQVGQYVPRNKANKCDYYTTEKYDRDEVFVL